jgi:hypothetical protein
MSTTIRSARSSDLLSAGLLGASLVRLHHGLDSERYIPATSKTEKVTPASWTPSSANLTS